MRLDHQGRLTACNKPFRASVLCSAPWGWKHRWGGVGEGSKGCGRLAKGRLGKGEREARNRIRSCPYSRSREREI